MFDEKAPSTIENNGAGDRVRAGDVQLGNTLVVRVLSITEFPEVY